jgi:membrane protease YdiL (CAAX protease family)
MGDLSSPRDIIFEGRENPWLRPELRAPWREIFVVIAIIIGYSTLISSLQAWSGSSRDYMANLLTDRRMVRTIAVESAILGLLFVHLHWRSWKVSDLKIRPAWRSTGVGLLLIPGMAVANSITVVSGFLILYALQTRSSLLVFILSNSPHIVRHSIHLSWFALIPAVIFNGFFEEITCMRYAFGQFAAKRGPLFALVVTVLLRMSCHTYQGVIHACGIGAAFFVLGLVYWRTQNLWPLILAHIAVDMLSFTGIKFLFG